MTSPEKTEKPAIETITKMAEEALETLKGLKPADEAEEVVAAFNVEKIDSINALTNLLTKLAEASITKPLPEATESELAFRTDLLTTLEKVATSLSNFARPSPIECQFVASDYKEFNIGAVKGGDWEATGLKLTVNATGSYKLDWDNPAGILLKCLRITVNGEPTLDSYTRGAVIELNKGEVIELEVFPTFACDEFNISSETECTFLSLLQVRKG